MSNLLKKVGHQKSSCKGFVRIKTLHLLRSIFTLSICEKFLVSRLSPARSFWNKFIPPVSLYRFSTIRRANRYGINFRLDISKLNDHRIYFHLGRNKSLENALRLVKRDFVVIDVGANIGFFSLLFAKSADLGTIYCFEPDTDNYEALLHNISINNFANIRTYNNALGDKVGAATLFKIDKANPGMHRILDKRPDVCFDQERIDLTTLDALVSARVIGKVNLVKIDCEGYELFVLQGARGLISRFRPILFIELIDSNLKQHGLSSQDLILFIETMNYTILNGKTMQPLSAEDAAYIDIICLPEK